MCRIGAHLFLSELLLPPWPPLSELPPPRLLLPPFSASPRREKIFFISQQRIKKTKNKETKKEFETPRSFKVQKQLFCWPQDLVGGHRQNYLFVFPLFSSNRILVRNCDWSRWVEILSLCSNFVNSMSSPVIWDLRLKMEH